MVKSRGADATLDPKSLLDRDFPEAGEPGVQRCARCLDVLEEPQLTRVSAADDERGGSSASRVAASTE